MAQLPLFNLFFLGLGLALGWGVRRFHNNIYFEVHVFQPNIIWHIANSIVQWHQIGYWTFVRIIYRALSAFRVYDTISCERWMVRPMPLDFTVTINTSAVSSTEANRLTLKSCVIDVYRTLPTKVTIQKRKSTPPCAGLQLQHKLGLEL